MNMHNLKNVLALFTLTICVFVLLAPRSVAQAQEQLLPSLLQDSAITLSHEENAFSHKRKRFDIRLSFFAGTSIRTILGNTDVNSTVGIRFGVNVVEHIYFGGRASIHPYSFYSPANDASGGMPLLLGVETGYEFRLNPTMSLLPYLGLGYYGVDKTYIGYGTVRISPEYPSYVAMFGLIYSAEVAPNLLLGAEISIVARASTYLNIHVGYRF